MTNLSGARPLPSAETQAPGPAPLQAERLRSAFPHLRHGFSAALPRLDDTGLAEAVSAWMPDAVGQPWLLAQPHGTELLDLSRDKVGRPDAGSGGRSPAHPVPGYDGALARMGALGDAAAPTLVVKAADCVSVLAVEPVSGAYAALHAGWRGVAAGILPRLLAAWQAQGIGLSGVRLAFGPHIRACCFEVREDCLAQFEPGHLTGAVSVREQRSYLDLERVLRTQAEAGGLTAGQIEVLPQCTRCHRDADGEYPFASYRRAQQEGQPAGRNVAFIGPAA